MNSQFSQTLCQYLKTRRGEMFLQSLAEYKDVHEALLDACEFLKQQEHRQPFFSTKYKHK
ncbi:MAG: hypothetical protein AB4426_35440 [Xenococcaceae cyanobacterium]